MTPDTYISMYFPTVVIVMVLISLAIGYAYGFLDGKNYKRFDNKKARSDNSGLKYNTTIGSDTNSNNTNSKIGETYET